MENFKEKMMEACNDIISITQDSIDMTGCAFEETFPATSFKGIEVDGQKFQLVVEVKVRKIDD